MCFLTFFFIVSLPFNPYPPHHVNHVHLPVSSFILISKHPHFQKYPQGCLPPCSCNLARPHQVPDFEPFCVSPKSLMLVTQTKNKTDFKNPPTPRPEVALPLLLLRPLLLPIFIIPSGGRSSQNYYHHHHHRIQVVWPYSCQRLLVFVLSSVNGGESQLWSIQLIIVTTQCHLILIRCC